MKITVKSGTSYDRMILHFKDSVKVQTILEKLNFNPDAVIVMKDNRPIPITSELKNNEDLLIITVKSGG
jgi:sulfur carrier protein ThiS